MKKIMYLFSQHVELLNYDEILQASSDDLIWNEDNTLTFVTWEGDNPSCINDILDISKYDIKTLDDLNNLSFIDKWSYYISQ